MVTEVLCHEDDEARRYDESEVAQIAADHAPLFLKFVGAASNIVGLTAAKDAGQFVEDVALKKSSRKGRSSGR